MATLVAVALGVRIAAVLVVGAPVDQPATYEHGEIAENLLAGRGFSVRFLGVDGPTSQQAPWVPLLLAACAWPFGHVTPGAVALFQLLQCFAGTALVVAAVRMTWRWFPERRGIGWAVGWAAALFPPHVYMVTHVQAAVWAALGVASLSALLADPVSAARPRTALLCGLLLGWLLLVDPIFAFAAPLVAWRLLRIEGPSLTQRLQPIAACSLAAVLVVGPWLVRNAAVHGEFVFVKSTFGYAFWQGNNPLSLGTDKLPKSAAADLAAAHDGSLADRNRALWDARHETLYIDDVVLKPTGYRDFVGLSEPARSRLLGGQAWQYVVARPAEYLERCARRLRYFLLWDSTNPKTLNGLYRTSSVLWLTLAAVGLLAARRHWHTLAPSMLLFAGVMLFHTLTITSVRFRIPVEVFGFVWAAVGFAPAVTNLARHVSGAWHAARVEEEAAAESTVPPGHRMHGPHTRPAGVRSRSILRRD